jgi:hypothetical protein
MLLINQAVVLIKVIALVVVAVYFVGVVVMKTY